jgi:hypothetical protein
MKFLEILRHKPSLNMGAWHANAAFQQNAALVCRAPTAKNASIELCDKLLEAN